MHALGDYFKTRVERDVRRLGNIRDPSAFQRFVRLWAGRTGQLLNLSSLGADAGVSHNTARQWLSVLEASHVAFLLEPYFANVRRRLVKSSKPYFHDLGLAGYLLGMEEPTRIETRPQRGALFEDVAVGETLKYRFNTGRRSSRTSSGAIGDASAISSSGRPMATWWSSRKPG